tara:strand:- start:21 stop:233 length:213 start_codon:yes stop_codon:yes gene_type:complete
MSLITAGTVNLTSIENCNLIEVIEELKNEIILLKKLVKKITKGSGKLNNKRKRQYESSTSESESESESSE